MLNYKVPGKKEQINFSLSVPNFHYIYISRSITLNSKSDIELNWDLILAFINNSEFYPFYNAYLINDKLVQK